MTALNTLLLLLQIFLLTESSKRAREKSLRETRRTDRLSNSKKRHGLSHRGNNDNIRVDGMPLFQGDMVMEEGMVVQIMADSSVSSNLRAKIYRMWLASQKRKGRAVRRPRAAVKSTYRIWGDGALQRGQIEGTTITSYGIIPYVFAPNIASWKRSLIEEAMLHWEENTRLNGSDSYCVKFVPRSDEENYVNFVYTEGCWSKVGKSTKQEAQNISLGPRCGSMGLIAHEIGHALGFFHEQSRPDRDQWIKILTENVRPKRTYNFVKYEDYLVDPRNVEYDYYSIMHYSLDAFSRNGFDTIEPLQPVDDRLVIGQREAVSSKDISQIRRMYGCVPPEKETTVAPTTKPESTEEGGSWTWDFRLGRWIWNVT